jgi:hypothetical protein
MALLDNYKVKSIDGIAVGGVVVLSYQTGSVQSESSPHDVVINAVDLTQGFAVIENSLRGVGNDLDNTTVTIEFLSDVAIRLQAGSVVGGLYDWKVWNLEGAISVQYIQQALPLINTNINIAEVDPEKCMIYSSSRDTSLGDVAYIDEARTITFNSSTQIRVETGLARAGKILGLFIVEYP